MAVKMIPIQCSACGAVAQISSDRKIAFCEYCGTQLIIQNDNEFTFNYADTADVIRAQTEQAQVLNDIREKNQAKANQNKIIRTLAIAGAALFGIGILGDIVGTDALEIFEGLGIIVLGIALYLFVKQNKTSDDTSQVPYQPFQQTRNHQYIPVRKPKEKWVAFCLCLFLGYIGAHKFYEGKVGMGILYLFTVGLFGIGWIYDLIKILMLPNTYYV